MRITSNRSYNHGLFILDLAHMPGGICGTWPACKFPSNSELDHFSLTTDLDWLVGPNWPNEGEIDIIEGVNANANNAMTLHTSDGCTITDDGGFTGTLGTTNCYVDAAGQSANAGCSIENQNTQSYGTGFNDIGGGVIATEWTSTDINIWFFPRGTTPADVTNGDPDPSSWKEPVAQYQGGCDIDSHFQNQQIVSSTFPPIPTPIIDNDPSDRSSIRLSAVTGLAPPGVVARNAHLSLHRAKTTCRTTQGPSHPLIGLSTHCRCISPMARQRRSVTLHRISYRRRIRRCRCLRSRWPWVAGCRHKQDEEVSGYLIKGIKVSDRVLLYREERR